MKLLTTTRFDLTTSLAADPLIARVQEFLDRLQESHPEVLGAHVEYWVPPTFEIRLALAPMSFGDAEALVEAMAEQLQEAIADSEELVYLTERETELAPA